MLAAAAPAPDIDYAALSPMIVVFAAAVVGVLVEAFAPRRGRFTAQVVLSGAGLIGAFAAVIALAGTERTVMAGSVTIDGAALYLQGTILVVGFLSLMLFADRRLAVRGRSREPAAAGAGAPFFAPQASAIPGGADEALARRAGIVQSEIFPLAMFSVGGMMLFPASADLITMFIALEVLSLPLYLLCGLARHRRLISQEAALKYFLLGAYSSAFFIFGAALLYGYAGTVSLDGIAEAARVGVGTGGPGGATVLALVGAGLLGMGLLFKVGAVPFHSWIPDVYQGAPTPVTAFMASATKIAAFGALLRVFLVALPALHDQWRPVLWAVAIATMIFGSVVALTQTDIKRMLAYSSVSHIGFMLTAVVPASDAGLSAVLFYLAAYGVSAVGAFALAGLVRGPAPDGSGDGLAPEAPDTAKWAGLGRRHPVFGSAFALLLLAFAGIPLTSGFVAKFDVFAAALGGGATALVIVGVVCSAIAAFFYVRVIVLMFFGEPDGDTPVVATPGALTAAAVSVSVVVTIVLGVAPQPLLDLADRAAPFFG